MKNLKIIIVMSLTLLLTSCFEKYEEPSAVEILTWATIQEELTQTWPTDNQNDEESQESDENTSTGSSDVDQQNEVENQVEQALEEQQEEDNSQEQWEVSASWTIEIWEEDQESINASIEELQQILTWEDIDKLFE